MNKSNVKPISIIKVVLLLICTLDMSRNTLLLLSDTPSYMYNLFLYSFWPFVVLALLFLINFVLSLISMRKQPQSRKILLCSLVLSVLTLPVTFILLTCYSYIDFSLILMTISVIVILVLSALEFSNAKTLQAQTPTPTNISSVDKLVKYKELLNMGAITQEEFEEKKKQLLNQ